jgi:histidinol-phosphate aminotransferase
MIRAMTPCNSSSLMPLIRDHYRDLSGYLSAGMETTKTDDLLFLNANENPFELPGLEAFNRYPEPQPIALAEAYGRTYGVNPDHIVMTRGADEAIVILTKLLCEPNRDAVLISTPTFGMYGVNANAMPATLVDVPLIKTEGTFEWDIDGIIDAATDPAQHITMLYLCSPNNPTGTSLAHDDIAKICEATDGHAAVILDETYAEFSKAGSIAHRLSDLPNLVILRTLSKSYALAGMRMGCFLCADEGFVQTAKTKAMDAYPLPHASIDAALHVMSPDIAAQAKANIQTLLSERVRMEEELGTLAFVTHIHPSDANFLLVKIKESAKTVHAHCAENGIILRDFSSKPATQDCLRISIGTPEQNTELLDCLHKFS